MIGYRLFGGLLVGGAVMLTLSGCGERHNLRYKMTVEVETPQGVKSGFAVREVQSYIPPNIPMLGEDRGGIKLRGEAVVVDIAPGQTLFALLAGGDGDVDYGARIADRSGLWNIKSAMPKGASITLWPDAPKTDGLARTNPLPMLVTFKDLRDPTSVKRVDPDDLAASFGTGYRLKSITVQVTDAPVTVGIGERLKSIGMSPDNSLDKDFAPTTNPTLAQQLGYSDFVRR
jgi:hypothetical protein